MSSSTPDTPRDLRLPDHRHERTTTRGPRQIVGAAAGAVGVALIAAIYLIGAPLIAIWTGCVQIVSEIRENAMRPRPFQGTRHGLPFLDPPNTTAAATAATDEAEE